MTNTTRTADTIADLIAFECRSVLNADNDRNDAKDALDVAKTGAMSARETLMVGVAELSDRENWTTAEITQAVKLVVARDNGQHTKTLETLGGEIKNAAAPNVRKHTRAIVDLANAAWEREQEAYAADKTAPTPIKKGFQRKYHVITGLFKMAADNTLILDADALIAEATKRDPDMDAKKVAKRLEKMATDLQTILRVFPHDDLKVVMDTLAEFDHKMLTASQPATTVAEPAPAPATVPETVPETVPAKPVPQLKVVPTQASPTDNTIEPAGGVVDIDDMLAGFATNHDSGASQAAA